MDISEKDAQTLQTGRLLRAESDIMLPMLNERREAAVSKIIMYYRSGELEKITQAAAELSVTEDLKQTIKNKIKLAETVERRVEHEQRTITSEY